MSLLKIPRSLCLDQYEKLPTCTYDSISNEEINNFPKIYGGNWYKIELNSKQYFAKHLSEQIMKFLNELNINELIFIGDSNLPWISKSSRTRNDYPPLKKAITYFDEKKIGIRFNGAIRISIENLSEFLKNLYCIIRCGGPQPYFYFVDEEQSLLGSIHYSGEVQLLALNKKTVERISNAITQTNLIPSN